MRQIFDLYLKTGSVRLVNEHLDTHGWVTPVRESRRGRAMGGRPLSRGHLYKMLGNPIYIGRIAHKGQDFDGQHPALIDMETWTKVQELLKVHHQGERPGQANPSQSVLMGIVFDSQGRRLRPSHTKKGPKRYRYYVNDISGSEAIRIAAHELEGAVTAAVIDLLGNHVRLASAMEDAAPQEIAERLNAAATVSEQLRSSSAEEHAQRLKRMLTRVEVSKERLQVTVVAASCWSETIDQAAAQDHLTHDTPITLKRRGTATKIVIASPSAEDKRWAEPDARLITLLTRAQDWFERLRTGQAESIPKLAEQVGFSPSHVTRVLYAAFLAPEVVKAIAVGEQPRSLTADRLMKLLPLPTAWTEQRGLLGFSRG